MAKKKWEFGKMVNYKNNYEYKIFQKVKRIIS